MIARGRTDPILFAKKILGLDLNPFQERFLLETENSPENLILAGNRVGKTVALAIKHIRAAFYKFGLKGDDPKKIELATYRTFNISPVSRQSKLAMEYIEKILTGSFTWERDGKRYSNTPKEDGSGLRIFGFLKSINHTLGEIRYANNSVTLCLSTAEDTGSSFQGLSAGYISFDECVQTQHFEADLNSMISRLGDYGYCLDLVTTPDANPDRRNAQYELYHLVQRIKQGEVKFKLITGHYDENFFIPEEQRNEQKERIKRISPHLYNQIIHGEFVFSGKKVFEPVVIEQIWIKGVKYEKPTPPVENGQYVIIADWGFSDTGDDTVIHIWRTDIQPYQLVYHLSVKGANPDIIAGTIRNLKFEYNDADIVHDSSSLGGIIMQKKLADLKPIALSYSGGGEIKERAHFKLLELLTNGRKPHINDKGMVEELNNNYGLLRSPYIPEMASQLANYQLEDKKIKQDEVICLQMFAYYIEKKEKNKIRVFNLKI